MGWKKRSSRKQERGFNEISHQSFSLDCRQHCADSLDSGQTTLNISRVAASARRTYIVARPSSELGTQWDHNFLLPERIHFSADVKECRRPSRQCTLLSVKLQESDFRIRQQRPFSPANHHGNAFIFPFFICIKVSQIYAEWKLKRNSLSHPWAMKERYQTFALCIRRSSSSFWYDLLLLFPFPLFFYYKL